MITSSKRPVAAALQAEDREGDDRRDQAGGEQRDAEEQVQRDRRADELGEVGRHRDQLGLDPEPERDRPREVLAAELGQVLAGRDADLRRQVLDQHRHQVRGEQHPQQQVAELRAAGDVRGEVAGVDVGDARDERRAEHRERAPQPSAGPGLLELAGRGRAGGRSPPGSATAEAGGGGVTPPPPPASPAPARRRARASSPPKRTNSGPSNGCFSTTSNAVAGRDPPIAEVAQHLGVGVRDAHEDARGRRRRGPACAACRALLDRAGRGVGIGSPCGSCVGWPSLSAMSSSSSSEMTCSSTSASSCTRSHGTPSRSARYSSSSRWWRSTSSARRSPSAVSSHAAVRLVADEAERVELLDHPRRRRGRDAEALGERVRGHAAALALLQRVDRLRVVLDGLTGAGAALDGAHAGELWHT